MRTTTAPTSGNTTKKKTRPVTVTIMGELAQRIRQGAKDVGHRADTWARMCIEDGDLVSSDTEEAKAFRRSMARHAHGEATEGKLPIYFPAATVRLLDELLEASGTGLTSAQYAEQFLQSEIIDSLDSMNEGIPLILAGGYQLEPDDFVEMQAVIDRWNAGTVGGEA